MFIPATRTFATCAKTVFEKKGPETLDVLRKTGKVVTEYISPKARGTTTSSFKAAQTKSSENFKKLGDTIAEQNAHKP